MLSRLSFILLSIVSISCQKPSTFERFEQKDGSLSILDKQTGKVFFINKSNRIEDIVDLDLDDQEIQFIRNEKARKDSSQKYMPLGTKKIPGTQYTLALSTRFYKDKCLYKIRMSPYDESLSWKSETINVNLRDKQGFLLEIVAPRKSEWYRSVDSNGVAISMASEGQIAMTLDNYLEIDDWSMTWNFDK